MPRIYDNAWQGDHKRVLCLCSANMLRSPTMQVVLSSEPFNYNTRSAGVYDFALIPLSVDLIKWADEIVCADTEHVDAVERVFLSHGELELPRKPVINLMIPDIYDYRNPELMRIIKESYLEHIDDAA